jgi:serine/threonine-protein kinase
VKSGFWKSDWFLGLIVAVLMLFAGGSELLQSLERKAYDMGVKASTRTPSDRIAIIAIDKQSLDNIGRWPWSRDVHARMVQWLAAAKAKVIGYTVFFAEPQLDPGYQYISKLLELATRGSGSGATPSPELSQFVSVLREAEDSLNTDRKLAASIQSAGDVVLPMLFTLGEPRGRPDKPLPDFMRRNAIVMQGAGADIPELTSSVDTPVLPELGAAAAAVGHLNAIPDVDGAIRTEALAVTHFDEFYPSLAVMIVAKSLNLAAQDVKVQPGESLRIGNLKVGTDPRARMYTYYYANREGRPAFEVDSFYDVMTGKIPADKYRDKIVLIGPTAAGIGSIFVTPVSAATPSVIMQAHVVSSLLQEHFFVVPGWAAIAELAVFLLVAVYVITVLPRLKAGPAAGATAGILVLLLGAHFGLMVKQAIWVQLMVPATLLLFGHIALVTKRFIVTERAKLKSDESSAESNRMLGLAYQGQGQLDMAWDKFRQVPRSEPLLENLYNLALDFERKRQFNKAEAVLRHIHEFNPKFRDVEQKLSRAKQLAETVILGGTAAAGRTNTSILGEGGAVEKPMLGRYQVEKELGKGAMGVVYLGKDPKIGRVVAIKTMALAQEFEPEELAEVKERFFREAETAGRLSHPNIVTIYDAGEEHDLCYIAMELLKGGDLVPFTKAGNLLPVEKVVSIVARVADALGYAHKQGVVHRDIKPANVMYHLEGDSVKVTDFGIARLTDSSKTKTGMVLGTPSYMSPEQLAGKKIEGRSDLFSLAVSLYQLLSGRLPFEGDSMAQLMFKIASETPTDITSINPNIPPGIVAFLDRAMAKNPDERFQSGEEFAQALRAAAAGAPASPAGRQSSGERGVDIEL